MLPGPRSLSNVDPWVCGQSHAKRGVEQTQIRGENGEKPSLHCRAQALQLWMLAKSLAAACMSSVRGAGTTFTSTLKGVFLVQVTGRTTGTRPGHVPPGLGRNDTVTGHQLRRWERNPRCSRSNLETAAASVTSEPLALKNLMSYIFYLKSCISGKFCALTSEVAFHIHNRNTSLCMARKPGLQVAHEVRRRRRSESVKSVSIEEFFQCLIRHFHQTRAPLYI